MIKRKRQTHATSHISLLDFCQTFAHLPVTIACTIITRLPEDMRFSRMFTKFEGTKLFKLRRELMEQRPPDLASKPFALATKWPHLPYGLVLHNYYGVDPLGGVFVLQGVADGLPYRLMLQPFSTFVAALTSQEIAE